MKVSLLFCAMDHILSYSEEVENAMHIRLAVAVIATFSKVSLWQRHHSGTATVAANLGYGAGSYQGPEKVPERLENIFSIKAMLV